MHRFFLPGLLLLAACTSDTKSTTPSGDGAETTAPDGERDRKGDDFFVFGEMRIEVSDLLIGDLQYHYDADAEDILNGFFFGDWVDGVFGEQIMITLSYQTIRTKAWNGRWLLEDWWTAWVADGEIWAAFWTIDGVLATLDAADII